MNGILIDRELSDLISAWRRHRRAARKLAKELGSFDVVPHWLNAQLTLEDLLDDQHSYGLDPLDILGNAMRAATPTRDC